MFWRRKHSQPNNTVATTLVNQPAVESRVVRTVEPWTVSAIERPPVAEGLHGYVDAPSSGLTLHGWVAIEGWCFSEDGSPVTVTACSGQTVVKTLRGDLPRADVAEAYATQNVADTISMPSGFGGDLELDFLGSVSTSVESATIDIVATNVAIRTTLATLHLHPGVGATEEEATSQAGETQVLWSMMPHNIPTIVVDIGAHDGRFLSNSYPFIAQGWKGLLIEPLPAVFERLVANHERHPNATCLNIACGAQSAIAQLFIGTDGELGQNSTLSTDDTGWMREHRSDQSISVQVEPISKVLDAQGINGDIGLLLVDCEGMDLEALQGLDPSRHRPWIVVTEQYAQNPAKEQAKAELLRSWGLTFRCAVGYNDIWIDGRVVIPVSTPS